MLALNSLKTHNGKSKKVCNFLNLKNQNKMKKLHLKKEKNSRKNQKKKNNNLFSIFLMQYKINLNH